VKRGRLLKPALLDKTSHYVSHAGSSVCIYLLVMSVATLSHRQSRIGTPYLSAGCREVTGLHGIKLVPQPSKGAGGAEFCHPDGKLILMMQRMLNSDALYSATKKMKGTVKAD